MGPLVDVAAEMLLQVALPGTAHGTQGAVVHSWVGIILSWHRARAGHCTGALVALGRLVTIMAFRGFKVFVAVRSCGKEAQ